MSTITAFFESYLDNLHIPIVTPTDVIEIIIIALLVYTMLKWIKETRAWSLMRGLIVIAVFLLLAALLNMTTIIWIAGRVAYVGVIALIVVLQPELRKALENIGTRKYVAALFPFESLKRTDEKFSDRTINEIAKAAVEMGKAKTGALIVIQHNESLADYERTGIEVDAVVTSQLLINIFEHNTPLHDGAVVIRGDRVASATCYLPLSDSRQLSKDLGTRHRAGVGISEATDSMTVIVSEETGKISVAYGGRLYHGLTSDELKKHLTAIQDKKVVEEKRRFTFMRQHNENK